MPIIEITATRTVGPYTVATLSDGREIGAKDCGDKWTGRMVEVYFVDTERCTRGEHITMRKGSSRRLALDSAVATLNDPPKKVRLPRKRPVAVEPAPAHPVKELISGEGFDWLGTPHRLKVVHDGEPIGFRDPHKHQCWLYLRRDVATADTIIDWYIEQGSAYATEVVEQWSPRFGLSGVRVRVADTGDRWGHTRGSTITLHWATFQLPHHLVEYVIVHQLAHVADSTSGNGHGPAWRRTIDRCLYDREQREPDLTRYEQQCTVWMGAIKEAEAAA